MPNEFIARNGLISLKDSTISGSLNVTGTITGSFSGTASFATNAITASYADNFTVAGTITAQKLVVQTITSSVLYSSGSNIFGNNISNTQVFTGSLYQTGSTAAFMGNVGIGTTSPSYKFHVSGTTYIEHTGTTSVTHTLLFKNDNSAYGGLTLGSSGQPLIIQQNSGYAYLSAAGFNIGSTNSSIWTNNGSVLDIQNAAGSTTYLRIANTTGNVGIGTTAPDYKLTVAGSESTLLNVSSSGTIAKLQIKATYNNILQLGSDTDNTQVWYDGSYATSYIDNNYGAARGAFNQYGDIQFRSRLGSGTALTSSLTIRGYNGSVGIGTTVPAARLDVASGSAIFRNNLNNSTYAQFVGVHDDGRQRLADSSGYNIIGWKPGSYGSVGSNTGYFNVGSLPGMMGWRVGDTLPIIAGAFIGTDSATGGTHKSLKIVTGETGGTSGYIDFETFSMVGNVATGSRPSIRISADKFIIGSDTNNSGVPSIPTFFITGSNVGIGTTNPAYTLHVSGSGNILASNRVIAAGGVAADPSFATTSTIAGLFEPSYANLGFSSYAGEAGRIETSNRYWNIGMTGGTAKFNIRGIGATSATTSLLVQNSNANASLAVLDNSSVGIGTTIPSASLHIKGTTTSALSSSLLVQNSTGQAYFKVADDGTVSLGKIGDGEALIWSGNFRTFLQVNSNKLEFRDYTNSALGAFSSTGLVLTNDSDPFAINRLDVVGKAFIGPTASLASASLHVRGSGNSSATNAILVQNSLYSQSFLVRDDGWIQAGGATWGGIYVPREASYGTRSFLKNSDGNSIMSTISNAIVQVDMPLYVAGGIAYANTGALSIPDAVSSNNTALTLNAGFNVYGGAESNVIQWNAGGRFQADGRVNLLLVTGSMLNSGGGGTHGLRFIYYNPTFDTGGAKLEYHRAIETTSGDILFKSGSNTLMFVSESGNVGIGTSTPAYKLDVSGSARLTSGSQLRIDDATGGNYTRIQGRVIAFSRNNGTSEAVTLDGSSDNQLSIYARSGVTLKGGANDISIAVINDEGGASGNGSVLITGTGTATNSGSLHIRNGSNTQVFKTFDGGSVAVGTITAPTSQFQVKGSGTTSATTALLIQNSNASASLQIRDDQRIIFNGSSSMTIANSGSALSITRTGNYDNIPTQPLLNIIDISGGANGSKTAVYINVSEATANRAMEVYGGVGIGVAAVGSTDFTVAYATNIKNTATVFAASTYGLSSKSSISSIAAGNGGGISFWGDDRGQANAQATFAGIRGIKENSSYLNALGNLAFYIQSSSVGGSTESTLLEAARFDSSGRFGIGTTTPNAKLDVNGDVLVTGSLTTTGAITSAGKIQGNWYYAYGGGNYYFAADNGTHLIPGVYLGSTIPLVWTDASDVTSTVDVGLIRSGSSLLKVTDGSTGLGNIVAASFIGNITGSNALFTGTITAQKLVVQTISSSIIYSSGSNKFGNDVSNTQVFTGSIYSLVNSNYNLNLYNSASTNPQFQWKIGKGWPGSYDTSLLFTYGTGSVSAVITTDGYVESSGFKAFTANPGSSTALTSVSHNNSYIGFDQPTSGIPGNNIKVVGWDGVKLQAVTGNFSFLDGPNSTLMFISQSGNVGIGTTSPNYKLTIVGGINASAFSAFGGAVQFQSYLELINGNPMYFYSSGNTYNSTISQNGPDLYINPNNNVGIGFTNPNYKLDVNGSFNVLSSGINLTYTSGILYHAGGDGSYYQYITGIDYTFRNRRTGSLVFATDDTTRMTLDKNGNLGIGTTSPTQQLQTTGDAIIRNAYIGYISAFGTNYASLSHTSRTGTNDYSLLSENDGTTYINASSGKTIKFRISNIDKAILDSSGNFGISTLTPNAKLDVNGNVIITGSLANGASTTSIGSYSHAEGETTTAVGEFSHAEGLNTIAIGDYSHAEGTSTAVGQYSHAEGEGTTSIGYASHAEGSNTIAKGDYSHSEGVFTTSIGSYSHSEGSLTIASGSYSHSEGSGSISIGIASHAEGYLTTASGSYSHAEGAYTTAIGDASHVEGQSTTSIGYASHAEGYLTTAIGSNSHAEGGGTIAVGNSSHAEGYYTTAIGQLSHAEGSGTIAFGSYSHAEGYYTTAIGDFSHAEGSNTIANGDYQHVQGIYNISNSDPGAFILGNGTSDASRSNLIYAAGSNVQISGSLYQTGSLAYFAGSVGIGTATPSASLHVNGTVRIDDAFAGPSPTPGGTPSTYYGAGDGSEYLSTPDVWLKINVGGSDYVFPGYSPA